MRISGIWGDLLGNDAFSKFGIDLWWEKAHAVCSTLYVFLLFAFGVYSTDKQPACVPTKENASIYEVAGSDQFISDFCLEKAPRYTNIGYICYWVIYSVLIAEALSIIAVRTGLSHPLSLFSRAQEQHAELKLSLKETKLLVTHPNFSKKISKKTSALRVLRLLSFLQNCATKKTVPRWAVIRECYIAVVLLACFVSLNISLFLALKSVVNPIFNCSFEEIENVFWNINGTLNFVCTHPWTKRELITVYIYYGIFSIHFLSRIFSLCYVMHRRNKAPVLFLKSLWAHGRTADQQEFGYVVKYIFSEDYKTEVKKNIGLVGTCADLYFTKMAELSIDLKQVSLEPDLQGLIKHKRWEWIVGLVEKFPESFNDLSPLMEVDITALDWKNAFESSNDQSGSSHKRTRNLDASHFTEKIKMSVLSRRRIEGRSLLFYVLNRKPGCSTFHIHAAKCILECIRDQERVVCYNGGKISATHFVEMQHASDPTYPDRIKDQLLRFIEA